MRPAWTFLPISTLRSRFAVGPPAVEVQRRILLHVGEAHDLHGMRRGHRRGDLGQVAARGPGAAPRRRCRAARRARRSGRACTPAPSPVTVGRCRAGRPAPVSRSPVAKRSGASPAVEDDAAVVQVPHRRRRPRRERAWCGPCGRRCCARRRCRASARTSRSFIESSPPRSHQATTGAANAGAATSAAAPCRRGCSAAATGRISVSAAAACQRALGERRCGRCPRSGPRPA